MHWVDLHERRCPLLTIDSRIPKLDVAGSIPVSRSIHQLIGLFTPGGPLNVLVLFFGFTMIVWPFSV